MANEKIVLGLDIGVASVGWGLVKLTEESYIDENREGEKTERYKINGGEILGSGVRCFQLPQDRQKKSLALIRGLARRSRRTIRRKAQRMKRLIELAREYQLIGEDFSHCSILQPKKGVNKKERWDIWRIRKEALERPLTDIELFRVLYHIAKHRGFYFHTKAEEMGEDKGDSEKGKIKIGLARVRKMMEELHYQTIGEMFWSVYTQRSEKDKRKRNAKDQYNNSIPRLLLKDEITKIFESQQSHGNEKAKNELRDRYIEEILMREEGIDDAKLVKMMSDCEFTGAKCAPREGYTAERFMLFNRLNVLELTGATERDKGLMLDGRRAKIESLAYKNSEVTFAQVRVELGLHDRPDIRFNLCSYKEKNPEYKQKVECEVKGGQLKFEAKHKIAVVNIRTGELRVYDQEIRELFTRQRQYRQNKEKIYVYYSDIRKQLRLADEERFVALEKEYTKTAEELEKDFQEKVQKRRKGKSGVGGEKAFDGAAAYLKQFEDKQIFVKLEGYHKVRKAVEKQCDSEQWEQVHSDIDMLDVIAEALTYCKSDATRTDYLKEHGIRDERIIEAVLTINMKEVARFSREAMRKLLVHMEAGRLFNDARDQCGYGKAEYDKQAILRPYKGFFENNPVVARVISQTRKLVNAIVRKYNEAYPIDEIHIEVATELAKSEKEKTDIVFGQRRYQEDKQRAKERCLQCDIDPEEGQNLLMFRLAEQQGNICPYSGKKISFEPTCGENEVYILDCQIDHVIPMSRSFNDSLNNKVLCSAESNQNKRDMIPFEWIAGNDGEESEGWRGFEIRVKNMWSVPYGKKKNLLRKSWTEEDRERFMDRNLNDTRYASRHIADYLRKYFDFSKSRRDDIKEVSRIQLRSGGVTAFLRHSWGLNKNREENDLHHAVDALVTACSTAGHVYLVSHLAKTIERNGKYYYKHFSRDSFKPWVTIREDILAATEKIFVSRMPRHKVTAAAHGETIKSIKEMPDNKRVVKINQGYAEMGEMVRADIFVDGQSKYYVVPIYSLDIFSNKPLPDQYVPNSSKMPFEEWPRVSDNDLKFKFSLFKDDLISINGDKYYVDFFGGTRPTISVINIDGSIFESTKDKAREFRYRNVNLKKYSVDMFGNYKEILQENRPRNRFENTLTSQKSEKKRSKNEH